MPKFKLLVCTNSRFNPKNKSCAGEGSEALLADLKALSKDSKKQIQIEEIKCFGQCEHAPVMRIAPAAQFFYCVQKNDLKKIVKKLEEME